MPARIRIYGSPHCPMIEPVREILQRAKAPFDYIDISRDAPGRAALHQITHGYDTVPTVVFPDGLSLVEPTMDQLRQQLLRLGYQVHPVVATRKFLAIAANPATAFLGVMGVAIGIGTDTTWLWITGLILVLVVIASMITIRLTNTTRG